ncbi:hypothetical protein GOBAR_AA35373 [Gossypium barbadense]|uniref:Uncharacterized protein n=1 Tax=Gossypium barbadense TaxID=3634 RepID=A0A2P5W2I5_GOSBA|nr:hypothetical protein GOBAR_AA35373 [Gossypium barbadense]
MVPKAPAHPSTKVPMVSEELVHLSTKVLMVPWLSHEQGPRLPMVPEAPRTSKHKVCRCGALRPSRTSKVQGPRLQDGAARLPHDQGPRFSMVVPRTSRNDQGRLGLPMVGARRRPRNESRRPRLPDGCPRLPAHHQATEVARCGSRGSRTSTSANKCADGVEALARPKVSLGPGCRWWPERLPVATKSGLGLPDGCEDLAYPAPTKVADGCPRLPAHIPSTRVGMVVRRRPLRTTKAPSCGCLMVSEAAPQPALSKHQGADGAPGSRTTKGLVCRWCPRLPHMQGPKVPMLLEALTHLRHQGTDAARGSRTSEH